MSQVPIVPTISTVSTSEDIPFVPSPQPINSTLPFNPLDLTMNEPNINNEIDINDFLQNIFKNDNCNNNSSKFKEECENIVNEHKKNITEHIKNHDITKEQIEIITLECKQYNDMLYNNFSYTCLIAAGIYMSYSLFSYCMKKKKL